MALPAAAPDRTALVTGASSGIGEAIARELAARGHGVTLVARSADRLHALAAELSATGIRAEALPTDLTDAAARAALPDRVAQLGLEVSILVNNAGLSTLGPVHRSDPDAERGMYELNVMALTDLCARFLPGMVERHRGAVLNVASTAAFQPLPGQAGYGASKAFVLSYTRALGEELRGSGVVTTTLCPGPVDTGFGERAGFDHDEALGSLPSFMWETPDAVARTGLDALASGHQVAIPGPANRFAAITAQLTPKRVLSRLVASRHPGLRDR